MLKNQKNGERINILSNGGIKVLVRSVLDSNDFSHSNIQQSDYVYEWAKLKESGQIPVVKSNTVLIKKFIKRIYFLHQFLLPVYRSYIQRKKKNKLNAKNPGLSKIRIDKYFI